MVDYRYTMGYLISAPLVDLSQEGGALRVLDVLDFDKEKQWLLDALTETGRAIHLRITLGSALSTLRTLLNHGCRVLHYSGHALAGDLLFEDEDGHTRPMSCALLRSFFHAGGNTKCPDLVVLAACQSEQAAVAFVEAGVPHVIGIKRRENVKDSTAQLFAKQFYGAVFLGQTVAQAFNSASLDVSHITPGEEEGFVLLPEGASHDEVLFPRLPEGELVVDQPPALPSNLPAGPSPLIPEHVAKIAHTVTLLSSKDCRLITVTGQSGAGKATIAVAAARYCMQRRKFEACVFVDIARLLNRKPVGTFQSLAHVLSYQMEMVFGAESADAGGGGEWSVVTSTEEFVQQLRGHSVLFVLHDVLPSLGEEALFPYPWRFRSFVQALLFGCERCRCLLTATGSGLAPNAAHHMRFPEKIVAVNRLCEATSARFFMQSLSNAALQPRARELGIVFKDEATARAAQADRAQWFSSYDLHLQRHPAIIECAGLPALLLLAAQNLSRTVRLDSVTAIIQEFKLKDQDRARQIRLVIEQCVFTSSHSLARTHKHSHAHEFPHTHTQSHSPTSTPSFHSLPHSHAHTHTHSAHYHAAPRAHTSQHGGGERERERKDRQIAGVFGCALWAQVRRANREREGKVEGEGGRARVGWALLRAQLAPVCHRVGLNRPIEVDRFQGQLCKKPGGGGEGGEGVCFAKDFFRFWAWLAALQDTLLWLGPVWASKTPLLVSLVTRERSQRELQECPGGTFILRLSESKPGDLAVAVKDRSGRIAHRLLQVRGGRCCLVYRDGMGPQYHSLRELVLGERDFLLFYANGKCISKEEAFSSLTFAYDAPCPPDV